MGAERVELGRADIAPRTAVETFEGHAAPTRMRLPPSDIADLRYVFCEMAAESGLRSRHGRMAEAAAKERARKRAEHRAREAGVEIDVGANVATARRTFGPARNQCTELRAPPAVDRSTLVTIRTGDGRTMRAYVGVVPRKMPDAGLLERAVVVCKGSEESESESVLNAAEAWVDAPRSALHARGAACRAALTAMQRAGDSLHVVVLHLAYGDRAPAARYDLWERELAPLVQYTPAARALARAQADAAALARMTLADVAAAQAWSKARDRVAAIEKAIAEIPAALARRKDAIERGAAALVKLVAKRERAKGEAARKRRRRLKRQEERLVTLQTRRTDALTRFDAAMPDRLASLHTELAAAKNAARAATSVPVRDRSKAAIAAGSEREVSPFAVLERALAIDTARRVGESPKACSERVGAARAERARLIRTLAREAERMLVAASNAYRRAREAV